MSNPKPVVPGVPGLLHKPSYRENEYFTFDDVDKKRCMALKVKAEMDAEDAQRLRELHFMHCPKCGLDMHEVELKGLDVDVCFACGGVFLETWEIDVIAHPQQKGIMAAILNWFKEETKAPAQNQIGKNNIDKK